MKKNQYYTPPPIKKEVDPEEIIVPENVAYYDVAPNDNITITIDKDTEVELDEISIKSITKHNVTPEELNKPLGGFWMEPITSVSDQTDLEQYTP